MPQPRSKLTAAVIPFLAASVAACSPTVLEPASQRPMQATETTSVGEAPPPVVGPAATVPAGSRPLVLTARRILLTQLTQVVPEHSRSIASTGGESVHEKGVIDFRIEAIDADGNPARLAGELRIVLRCEDCDPEYSAFDVRIVDAADEARVYDATLDLYVVRVEPRFRHAPKSGAPIDVTIALNAADGVVIESRGQVRW